MASKEYYYSCRGSPKNPGSPAASSSSQSSYCSAVKSVNVSRSCICAPTSHKGSFRCRFHRTVSADNPANAS